jgi:hypothetical protein
MRRTIRRDGEKVKIHNEVFRLNEEDQGTSFGLSCFARQVEQAKLHGVSLIDTNAYRVKGETYIDKKGQVREKWAGYYVWPSYGYDGPLSAQTKKALRNAEIPARLKAAKKISQLMADDQGKAWWKEEGMPIDVMFDLKSESYSLKTLDRYLQKKMPVV